MKDKVSSKTADFVTALRAIHQTEQRGYILRDPYARELTSSKWRFLLANKFLWRFYCQYISGHTLNSSGSVFARQRYCEDLLSAIAGAEPVQYLLLGAGMDSFAFRREDLAECVTVFELDHPATQAKKRRRIAAAGLTTTMPVEYLSIDFQSQSLVEVLRHSNFEPKKRTFIAWLGVTYYLSEEAISGNLAALSALSAGRADLVFDCIDRRLFDPDFLAHHPQVKAAFTAFATFAERSGEPLLSGFGRDNVSDMLRKTGWSAVEVLDGDSMSKRYFKGDRDHTWPSEFELIVHCQTAVC